MNWQKKIESDRVRQVTELEQKNQSSWKSIRRELINVNSQFERANRSLSGQFDRQINNLKQDLDGKLSEALDDWSRQRAALQEWAVQRDEMRPDLDDYETKKPSGINICSQSHACFFRRRGSAAKIDAGVAESLRIAFFISDRSFGICLGFSN